jgi:hypothetical protein
MRERHSGDSYGRYDEHELNDVTDSIRKSANDNRVALSRSSREMESVRLYNRLSATGPGSRATVRHRIFSDCRDLVAIPLAIA